MYPQPESVHTVRNMGRIPDCQPTVHDKCIQCLSDGEPGVGWIRVKAECQIKAIECRVAGGPENCDDPSNRLTLPGLSNFGKSWDL